VDRFIAAPPFPVPVGGIVSPVVSEVRGLMDSYQHNASILNCFGMTFLYHALTGFGI